MHNSFTLRNLLARTNADPLYVERRDPHRGVERDPAATAGAGEFALAGVWGVRCTHPDAATAAVLAADVTDFLPRLGVAVTDAAASRITLALDASLPARACRLHCTPEDITVSGGDTAGLWAGVAWLEWEMRTRRGPFLPVGTQEHHAAWPEQISQGPWGGNYSVPDFSPAYVSDDSLRLYAHYGVNRMMIYGDLLCYTRSNILPEVNHPDAAAHLATLAEASERAARYGVQFTYVVVGPKLRPEHPVFAAHPEVRGAQVEVRDSGPLVFLCSSSETTLAFYEETFTQLFTAAPHLAGVILILYSESLYHCRIWDSWGATKIPCPRCGTRDPHPMVAELVARIERGIKTAQPNAGAATWIYTWDQGDRRELFRQFPPEVMLFHHIEKDGRYPREGYTKLAWDYSIDCTGPSEEMCELADFAHATGRPLGIKTETGIGLEVFQFPYVPAMPHLADKWQGVRDLRPALVHQSWLFFGMFGSRAEELGRWAAYRPDISRDDYLRRMAVRDFGPEAAPAVLRAWEAISAGVRHLPCTTLTTYYIGPSFLGPCHPLAPATDAAVPDAFYGNLFYLQEGEETFSVKHASVARTCLAITELPETLYGTEPHPGEALWDIVAREYAAAADGAHAAWQALCEAEPLVRTAADRQALREERLLTELIYRTFLSCAHVVRFLQARRRAEEGDDAARRTMRQLAMLERENALAAAPVYAEAPWLDLAARTDGYFTPCREMITAKVAWIDELLAAPV